MSAQIDWSNFGVTLPEEDEYVKFTNPGDKVEGVITDISTKEWPPNDKGEVKVDPNFTLDTATGKKFWTASQIQPKRWVLETGPQIGDWVSCELVFNEKRQGGKTLKHFKCDIKRAGASEAATGGTEDMGF